MATRVADSPGARLGRLREQWARSLAGHGRGGALFAALALGQRNLLPRETSEAAARGGVAHLLAVSGLHLGLVAGFAAWLIAWLLRFEPVLARADVRRLAWVGATILAAGYVALTGAPVSMQRAYVFLMVFVASGLARRPVGRVQRLALAAGAVLWLEPAALFAPGAQLSFVATAGLLLAGPMPAPVPMATPKARSDCSWRVPSRPRSRRRP